MFMNSETKLDENVPPSQLFINGFSSPYRLDRNCNGGGILLFIRQDIPSKLLSIERDLNKAFFVEITLHNKKKWLISCSYNPKRASIANRTSALSKCSDIYTPEYGNLIFLGEFNAGVEDTDIKKNRSSYNLISMVNKAACYNNPDKSTCIDLILTNCPGSFQKVFCMQINIKVSYKLI